MEKKEKNLLETAAQVGGIEKKSIASCWAESHLIAWLRFACMNSMCAGKQDDWLKSQDGQMQKMHQTKLSSAAMAGRSRFARC
jgi:hypothetical protein